MNYSVTITAIFLYVIGMIAAGYYAKRWVTDSSDYMLAGREFGAIVNVMGLSAVALAGSLLSFVPSLVISYGLLTAILGYIVFLGLGYASYGLLWGRISRENGAQTVAEYLELRYSSKVRVLVSIASAITMTGILANNILAIGSLFSGFLGFSPNLTVSICFIVIISFSLMSGLWGVTLTDMIQVVIGAIAIPIFMFFLMGKYGGFDWLVSHFPSENIWKYGTSGTETPIFSLTYPSFFTLLLNYGIFILWGNNYYYLRANTCRNSQVTTRSFAFAGFVVVPLILIPIAIIGAYALAAHPGVFGVDGTLSPAQAFGYMMNEAPAGLVTLILIAALGVTVSTASTALIGITATLSRDIYQRHVNKSVTPKKMLGVQRLIMLGVCVVGWLLCFYPGGTIQLFAFATSWLGPVSILFLMAAMYPKFTNSGAFWGGVSGMFSLTAVSVGDAFDLFHSASFAHTSVIGLFVTAIVGLIVSKFTAPNYYGDQAWEVEPTIQNRAQVDLNDNELEVLTFIRHGMISMAEISDYFGLDSQLGKYIVEKLDQAGYVKRKGLYGANFYRFEITQFGLNLLPELSNKEAKLSAAYISVKAYDFLYNSSKGQSKLSEYTKDKQLNSLMTTSLITILEKRGYIKQVGIMKRHVKVTPQGEELLKLHGVFNVEPQ